MFPQSNCKDLTLVVDAAKAQHTADLCIASISIFPWFVNEAARELRHLDAVVT